MLYPKFVKSDEIAIESDVEGNHSYRYALHIPFKNGGTKKYLVIMMNPSTADSTHSDPTIDRVIQFIEKNESQTNKVSIANLYPERETYSEYLDLNKHKHQKNIQTINSLLLDSDEVILGWGKPNKASQERLHKIHYHQIAIEVLGMCLKLDIKPQIIDSLRDNLYPRHPGRISYSAKLVSHDIDTHIYALKKQVHNNAKRFTINSE